MSVQTFLLASFKKSLSIMGSEEITIGSTKIQAIEDETASSNPLGIAATDNRRTLVVKFPADAYSAASLKSGMTVLARGESWQIASDDDSIRTGQIATTITLIEPERRDVE
jgi:5-keto 4-deoxyuronate isomerase